MGWDVISAGSTHDLSVPPRATVYGLAVPSLNGLIILDGSSPHGITATPRKKNGRTSVRFIARCLPNMRCPYRYQYRSSDTSFVALHQLTEQP